MKLLVAKPTSLHNQSLPSTSYAPMGQLPPGVNDVPWGLVIGGTLAVGTLVGVLIFYGRN